MTNHCEDFGVIFAAANDPAVTNTKKRFNERGSMLMCVEFLEGSEDVLNKWTYRGYNMDHEMILKWANEWPCLFVPHDPYSHGGIGNGDIRIKCISDGVSRSNIGYTNDHPKPTMFLNLSSGGDVKKKHDVIHEFGHALALIHEHQRPDVCKEILKYIDLKKMDIISHSDLEEELNVHDEKSHYDCESIMHYRLGDVLIYKTVEEVKKAHKAKDLGMTKEECDILLGLIKAEKKPEVTSPSKLDLKLVKKLYGPAKCAVCFENQSLIQGCTVYLSGSFNDWSTNLLMQDDGEGHHTAVVHLPLGRHEYKFIINGEWQHKRNEYFEENCYGTYNNVVNLTEDHTDAHHKTWNYLWGKGSVDSTSYEFPSECPPPIRTIFLH